MFQTPSTRRPDCFRAFLTWRALWLRPTLLPAHPCLSSRSPTQFRIDPSPRGRGALSASAYRARHSQLESWDLMQALSSGGPSPSLRRLDPDESVRAASTHPHPRAFLREASSKPARQLPVDGLTAAPLPDEERRHYRRQTPERLHAARLQTVRSRAEGWPLALPAA